MIQVLSFLHQVDYRYLISDIHQKVLLIHGEKDPLMPVGAAKWLAATLSNAILAVLGNTAHAPFLSLPDECAGIMGKFLGWS